MRKLDEVLEALKELQNKKNSAISAKELSEYINQDRANISRYLNDLYRENKVSKIDGRPVFYKIKEENFDVKDEINKSKFPSNIENLIGAEESLAIPIQQAKAAMLYPPRGLNTLILGDTGVGKSLFAEAMYCFAKDSNILTKDAHFIRFNCADYADNPQLVVAQIFGVKRGSFTGADKDKDGLLKKADGGVLFLDEIHRLSPQGQEMLFTFIDKGEFRVLGDTEKHISAKVQIIGATTEDPRSHLLKTFMRRIPMVIKLPSLGERSLKERYYLLENFAKIESSRLLKSIYFDKNSLISFLLYDCPSNIGQLKSDIQLSCAKAFLNYTAGKSNIIFVDQKDLPLRIQKGIMKLKEHRKDINEIFNNMGDIIKFSYKDNDIKEFKLECDENNDDNQYFYSLIEKNIDILRKQGINEKQLDNILNIDVQRYFEKYIKEVPNKFRKDEISKIVNIDVINIAEQILDVASKKLDREFDERVYFGLALHLQGSIERIVSGKKIFHPKLNVVRVEYEREFILAMELVKILENKFNIEVPLDEIGYIAMFFTPISYEDNEKNFDNVNVLVIMHGKNTASSMVEVANSLIGQNYVEALDMPLEMKVETMFEKVKKKVKELDTGSGVLLLVDMGSLNNFGEIIEKDVGIKVKTIDMVSTLTVIEAGRKALNGRDLKSIYESLVETKNKINFEIKHLQSKKGFLIITTCFTGEGTAERIKKFIKGNIKNLKNIGIKALNILDKDDFLRKVEVLKREYDIIANVSAINVNLEDIPFISASRIFTEPGMRKLKNLIENEQNYLKISEALTQQVKNIDSNKVIEYIREFTKNIEMNLNLNLTEDVRVGILMHIFFLIDKLICGYKERRFKTLVEFRDKYNKEFIMIKNGLKNLEKEFNVNINDNEIAYIVKMIVSNAVAV